jgi:hypothetical protein
MIVALGLQSKTGEEHARGAIGCRSEESAGDFFVGDAKSMRVVSSSKYRQCSMRFISSGENM